MFQIEFLQNGRLSLKRNKFIGFGIRFGPQTVTNVPLGQRTVVLLCECLCYYYYIHLGHTIKSTDAEVTVFCKHYDLRQIGHCLAQSVY